MEVYFTAGDPEGDDYGPGSYVYPRNLAFRPYEGLYDLLSFRVSGDGEHLFFDLQIKQVTNPWNAPEGFIHPVIHIYIDTKPGGKTTPFSEAFGVKLALAIWLGILFGGRGLGKQSAGLLNRRSNFDRHRFGRRLPAGPEHNPLNGTDGGGGAPSEKLALLCAGWGL